MKDEDLDRTGILGYNNYPNPRTASEPLVCPACSSTNIETTMENQSFDIPFGGQASVEIRVDRCRACQTDGDFTQYRNDYNINKARKYLIAKSVDEMIEYLGEQGIHIPYIERALELPQGTMHKWMGGEDCTPSDVALLRLIRWNPKLLEVADGGYEEET